MFLKFKGYNSSVVTGGLPVQRRIGSQGTEIRVGKDGRPAKGLQVAKNSNISIRNEEKVLPQGRMGSRRNGRIRRDDVDQLGQLLFWIVAEVF